MVIVHTQHLTSQSRYNYMALFNNNQKPKSFNIAPVVNFGIPKIQPIVSNFSPSTAIGNAFNPQTIKPVVKPTTKPKPNYSGSGNIITSNNSSIIPNMSMAPVYQGPKSPNMSMVSKTPQMSFVPDSTTKKNPVVTDKTTSNNYTTSYNNDNISYGNYNFDVGNKKVSSALPLGEAMAGSDYGDIGNLYRTYMSGGDIVDSSSIRSRAIADVQDRINALNQVYDQQLSRVQQEGVGRTGETTALLAARGLAGSMRGGSIADLTRTQNRQLEAQVDAERNSAIQGILSDANKAAMQEIQSKTEARLGGASALISFLKGSDERKQNYVNSVAQNLLSSGIDIQNMTPDQVAQLSSAAQKAGVSMNNILAAYNDAAYKAKSAGSFDLSEGQVRYDAQGNVIANNPKSATGYATTGIISPAAQALADQMTIGKAQWSNIPAALKGEVAIALNQSTGGKLSPVLSNISESKKLVDELLANTKGLKGATGTLRLGAAFGGSNASDFRAKIDRINSLLFLNAVPQMKGMGALTEREGAKLESSASTLNNYKQKESTYLNELKRLSQKLGESYQALGGDSVMQSSQSVSGTSSGGGTFAEAW